MLRKITLTLLLLLSLGIVLPFANSAAHGIRQAHRSDTTASITTRAPGGVGIDISSAKRRAAALAHRAAF